MRYLLVLLALASCASARPAKPRFAAIHILDIKHADDPALDDCIQRCDADDSTLAGSLKDSVRLQEAYLQRKPVSENELRASSRKLTQAAIAWYRKKKSSPDADETLAAYQLAVVAEGMQFADLTPPSFSAEVSDGISTLPTRFPNDARSYVLYGHHLSQITAPLEDVIRNYRHCLELDAKLKECRRRYDDAVADYEAKYCAAGGLDKSFGFYLSSDKKDAEHPVPLRSAEGKIYVAKKPDIDGADVARFMVAGSPSENAVSYDELRIEMTSEGARKLAALTEEHQGQTLAVALKGKALLNAPIMNPIRGGELSATVSAPENAKAEARSLFDTACPKPSARKLPADLQLDPHPASSKGA